VLNRAYITRSAFRTLAIHFDLSQYEVVMELQFTWASDRTALALKFVYGPYLTLTILIC
jgi:hypothetical protein